MPDKGRSFAEFLTERDSFGSNFNRLDDWKKNGEVVIWIHTNSPIMKRLFHMIPYVGTEKNETTGKEKEVIKFYPFVCHEEVADYLARNEPVSCPVCRLIDHLRNDDSIDSNETIWVSEAGDKKRDRICSKADFIGDADSGGDWRLTFKPTLQYIIPVVQDSDPSKIKIAIEKTSLGDAMKKSIMKEIDRRGPEEGDPGLNPYAIKWKYNANAKKSTDYYDAYPWDRAELTPAIQELLNEPAQDLSGWVTPGNTDTLHNIMERHICIDLGDTLNTLFDNVNPNQDKRRDTDTDTETNTETNTETKTVANSSKETRKREPKKIKQEETSSKKGEKSKTRSVKAKPVKKPIPEGYMECSRCGGKGCDECEDGIIEMDICGGCEKPIDPFIATCPHCGVTFE